MIICAEGCIGVGKTSLTKKLSIAFNGANIFEEFENNPFLKDFYEDADRFAFHVQSTFLFLQSKQFMKAEELAKTKTVFADFHPVKSKIFSNIVIKDNTQLQIINNIYENLFSALKEQTIIIYLYASPEIILERIKMRGDKFTSGISKSYIENVVSNYHSFFNEYKGAMISVDTNNLDFVKNERDWLVVKNELEAKINELKSFSR